MMIHAFLRSSFRQAPLIQDLGLGLRDCTVGPWTTLLPAIEIESVELCVLEPGSNPLLVGDLPALYAVVSGMWEVRIQHPVSSQAGRARHVLRSGEVLIVTDSMLQQFEAASDRAVFHPTGSVALKIAFGWKGSTAETANGVLPATISSKLPFPLTLEGVPKKWSRQDDPSTSPGFVSLLAQMLIGQILSEHESGLVDVDERTVDPDVADAIRAMQQAPGHPWTIQRLAANSGVSRSTLAQKFKEQVGQTLNDFLLNVRMRMADQLLRDRRYHLKEIARRSGYQSVSAFSTAFKRWSGSSPSTYRKSRLTQSDRI